MRALQTIDRLAWVVVGGEFVLGGGPREDFLFNQVHPSWILLKLTGLIFTLEISTIMNI